MTSPHSSEPLTRGDKEFQKVVQRSEGGMERRENDNRNMKGEAPGSYGTSGQLPTLTNKNVE
jgi:hypothetical protein